jgi:hypothetical protein
LNVSTHPGSTHVEIFEQVNDVINARLQENSDFPLMIANVTESPVLGLWDEIQYCGYVSDAAKELPSQKINPISNLTFGFPDAVIIFITQPP